MQKLRAPARFLISSWSPDERYCNVTAFYLSRSLSYIHSRFFPFFFFFFFFSENVSLSLFSSSTIFLLFSFFSFLILFQDRVSALVIKIFADLPRGWVCTYLMFPRVYACFCSSVEYICTLCSNEKRNKEKKKRRNVIGIQDERNTPNEEYVYTCFYVCIYIYIYV